MSCVLPGGPVKPSPKAYRRSAGRLSTLLCSLLLALPISAAAETNATAPGVDPRRDQFSRGMRQLQSGQVSAARDTLQQLGDYPLAPYLQMELLQRRLHTLPKADVAGFLLEHDGTVVADQLRRRWLTLLARRGLWQDYLDAYQLEGATTTHRCWHLRALWETGRDAQALAATTDLWMRADSLPNACDDPFRRWLASGQRTQPMIWQRLMLALQHDQHRLGRYLASQLQPPLHAQGQRLLEIHHQPERLASQGRAIQGGPHAGEVLAHGVSRLARRDADAATRQWQQWSASIAQYPDTAFRLRQNIARVVIASQGTEAMDWLLRFDPDAEDPFLLEWRIRLALRQGLWPEAAGWLTMLPEDLAGTTRWRYWKARTLAATGRDEAARETLTELAGERSFYGFIAADLLARAYGMNHAPVHSSVTPQQIETHPGVRRAREWLSLEDNLAARREWFRTLQQLDQEQRQAAALLAQRWGWHDQSIQTALRADIRDDLDVRFPLAYPDVMLERARHVAIDPEWLFAVARQESAFVPDARSPAGALGLLQLMPGTASEVARSLGQPHQPRDLLRPEHNVNLGSHYLAQLLREFGGNRILATAAYNAGPNRIARVLQSQGDSLPFDIWIETLPYHETRQYIQNVLSFSVIYSHRLGQPRSLLDAHEQTIDPALALAAREQRQR